MTYTAPDATAFRNKAGSLAAKVTSELALIDTEIDTIEALADGKIIVGNGSGVAADVTMSGDATIVNTGALTVSTGVKTKFAHLTAGMGTRTSVATAGVDLASGSNAVYYGVFAPGVAITITGMVSVLNEAYVKESTDAVIILKDRTGSPVTKCTYTLPTGGSAAKTIVTTTPASAAVASTDILDLYVTATGSSSGTGYADVFLKYIIT